MVKLYVTSDSMKGFYDYYTGSLTKSGRELRKQLEKKADRVFEKLDLTKIKTKEDYENQLHDVHYADPKKENAFRNWAIKNYGGARDWFYESFIRSKILERIKSSHYKLKNKIINGVKYDSRSYIQWINYTRADGKNIQFAQRRHIKSGKILPHKHLF